MRVSYTKGNMDSKNAKIFMIVFALISLIIGGLLFYKGYSTKDKGVEITAIISRIDVETTYRNGERKTDHDVYIDYTYNDEKFTNISYPVYTTGMHEGNEINVKLNPNNPTQFYTSTSDMIIGGVFILFGVVFLIISLKLKTSGNDTVDSLENY